MWQGRKIGVFKRISLTILEEQNPFDVYQGDDRYDRYGPLARWVMIRVMLIVTFAHDLWAQGQVHVEKILILLEWAVPGYQAIDLTYVIYYIFLAFNDRGIVAVSVVLLPSTVCTVLCSTLPNGRCANGIDLIVLLDRTILTSPLSCLHLQFYKIRGYPYVLHCVFRKAKAA